ncbi:Amino-acid acetyltransferase, mitochondrial, partial [Massospora cicadina]
VFNSVHPTSETEMLALLTAKSAQLQRRAFSSACCSYNILLRAQHKRDVRQTRSAHVTQLNSEKELILKVLEAIPSKREAKSYTDRFKVKGETFTKSCKSRYPIALVSLTVPMFRSELEQVSRTIAYIKRMGVAPILLLENIEFSRIEAMMIQDGLALCEMIERENVKTRLIPSGVFTCKDFNSPTEVDLTSVLSSLRTDSIPVLLPISCTSKSVQFASNSLATVSALSKSFSRYNPTPALIDGKAGDVMKVVIINSRGGIPNQNNETITFVNLQDDLEGLVQQAGDWRGHSASGWKRDLNLAYSSLAFLPATTSAVVLSASTINTVISNLITDKPTISPSLPQSKSASPDATILRYGLKVTNHISLASVDMERVWKLIEASFRRQIDKPRYLARLEASLSHLIVAGDYQGLAIVTNEAGGVCYLDKFGVDPQSQGIGVADVLWQQLRKQCPNLMWRSRPDNGVNKWYFERSDGNIALTSAPWRLFWYGGDGLARIRDYSRVAGSIPITFLLGGPGHGSRLPPK